MYMEKGTRQGEKTHTQDGKIGAHLVLSHCSSQRVEILHCALHHLHARLCLELGPLVEAGLVHNEPAIPCCEK